MTAPPDSRGTGVPGGSRPAAGDVVVVGSSRAGGDGAGPAARCTVVEWPSLQAVEGSADLAREDARPRARLLAGQRHRRAWEAVDGQLRPLPAAPVVSVSNGAYWVSIDVTEPEDGAAVTRWRSAANLSRDEALALLADSGFGGRLGAELLAGARPAQP